MKIETSTQKTIWVHLDPDELQKMLIDATCKASRLRGEMVAANVHFNPDTAGAQPSRRAMRASVELLIAAQPRPRNPRTTKPSTLKTVAGAA